MASPRTPNEVLAMLDQLAKAAGCELKERHELLRGPHYRYHVRSHLYTFRTADGHALEFRHHGNRLPLSLGTKRGRELLDWYRSCVREAHRSYA